MNNALKFICEEIEYTRYNNLAVWSNSIKNKNKEIDIVHLNIRSLRKQFAELLVMLNQCDEKIDLLILSEVNVKQEELSFYSIPGYNMHSNTREESRGGGVLMYAKDTLNFAAEEGDNTASEMLHGRLQTENEIIHVISVYRPPTMNKLKFVDEISYLLKKILLVTT